MTNRSIATPLRELRRLTRLRLAESRDTVGFNLAALRMVARVSNDRKDSYLDYNDSQTHKTFGLVSDWDAKLRLLSKESEKIIRVRNGTYVETCQNPVE